MSILTIPWLILVAFIATFYYLIKRKWILVVTLSTILIGGNCQFHLFSCSILSSESANSFKVMTFNIQGSEKDSTSIKSIERIIIQENADAVLLVEITKKVLYMMNEELIGIYPYMSDTYSGRGNYLLSKIPIVNSEPIGGNKHSILHHYTIAIQDDLIHLYGCHLASNNYTEDFIALHPDSIRGADGAKQYLKNIKCSSAKRQKQASSILSKVNQKNRCIILGDFNDISGSKPLRLIEGAGFHDAWWRGGFGYGATIHYPLPYRIDHIFYNDKLKLKSVRKIDSKGLSDHDALVAEFSF